MNKEDNYSIEFFQDLGIKGKHAAITFKTGSPSEKLYGTDISLIIKPTDEIRLEQLKRKLEKNPKNTYGVFTAHISRLDETEYVEGVVNTADILSADTLI